MRICRLKLNCQEQRYTKKKGKNCTDPCPDGTKAFMNLHPQTLNIIYLRPIHYKKFLYFKIEYLEIEKKTAVLGWRKSVLKYKKDWTKIKTYFYQLWKKLNQTYFYQLWKKLSCPMITFLNFLCNLSSTDYGVRTPRERK